MPITHRSEDCSFGQRLARQYGVDAVPSLLTMPRGVPEFGVEAAAQHGVDLERLVLVPRPGDQWMAVTAAIADIMGVPLVRDAAIVDRIRAMFEARGRAMRSADAPAGPRA